MLGIFKNKDVKEDEVDDSENTKNQILEVPKNKDIKEDEIDNSEKHKNQILEMPKNKDIKDDGIDDKLNKMKSKLDNNANNGDAGDNDNDGMEERQRDITKEGGNLEKTKNSDVSKIDEDNEKKHESKSGNASFKEQLQVETTPIVNMKEDKNNEKDINNGEERE